MPLLSRNASALFYSATIGGVACWLTGYVFRFQPESPVADFVSLILYFDICLCVLILYHWGSAP